MVLALVTAGAVPAHAGDLDLRARQEAQAAAPADPRFTLRADRFDYEPRSSDGSLSLRAVVESVPPEPVAETRFALGSRLRAKAVGAGDCAGNSDDLFANGFE